MKFLICAGDGPMVANIREVAEELLENRFLGMKCSEVFAVETKTGEIMIYILPDWDPQELPQRLEVIGQVLAERLSLNRSQVVCPVVFH